MTCKSCSHFRLTGCAQRAQRYFPRACDGPGRCPLFEYEPGSDEAEDDDNLSATEN